MNEKKFILHVCFLLFWLAAFVVVLIYSWFSYYNINMVDISYIQ